jgi:hypothetical protein
MVKSVVKPKINIPANAIGIEAATQKAILQCRKNPRQIKTRKKPIIPFSTSKSILCVKGRAEKIVTSRNPKCSNGYKKIDILKLKPRESGPCFEIGKLSGKLTCVASGGEKIWFKLTLEQSKDGYPIIGSKCFRNDVVAMGYNSSNEYVPIVCSFRESGHFPKWLDI